MRHVALVAERNQEGRAEPSGHRELAEHAHKIAQAITAGHESDAD